MAHNTTYKNPIIPGFAPDPSICRVGADYYLVVSTFEYFPGLPIFHSRDLVNWRQIGHVLDRPSQLDLDNMPASGGLYAPTIRYHEGTFYVINTLVGNSKPSVTRPFLKNFIVTATDPAGPWSEPYWLEDATIGIDPSLLFDDDGRVWFCGNRMPAAGETFTGEREIYLQELDLATMQLTGPTYGLFTGAVKHGVHAEAPHIYKINDMYYLLIAEGGTNERHAITIARSESITGPYETNQHNPLLTHRHLGLDYPIACTGHGDLIETQNGEWWMVLLATRPVGGFHYNTGRETFLVPVRWEDNGWPIVSPGIGRVEFEHKRPDLPLHRWPTLPICDNFEAETLDFRWNFLRTPRSEWWSLTDRPGYLRLHLRRESITETVNPSWIGRRQQHLRFAARAALEFAPDNAHECAGLVLLQNDRFQYRMVVTLDAAGALVAQIIQRADGDDRLLGTVPIDGERIYFKVEAYEQDYSFYVATEPEAWITLYEGADGRILSTEIAGGFTGAYIGLYASSNGQPSDNVADFDWFEYVGLEN